MRSLLSGIAVIVATTPAFARESADVSFLQTLFHTTPIDASLFDAAFTQRVPLADVQTLVDGYRQRLGSLQSVERDANGDQLRFANGSLRATVQLAASDKVAGLRFHDEQSDTDRAAVERALRAEHADRCDAQRRRRVLTSRVARRRVLCRLRERRKQRADRYVRGG